MPTFHKELKKNKEPLKVIAVAAILEIISIMWEKQLQKKPPLLIINHLTHCGKWPIRSSVTDKNRARSGIGLRLFFPHVAGIFSQIAKSKSPSTVFFNIYIFRKK